MSDLTLKHWYIAILIHCYIEIISVFLSETLMYDSRLF